MKRSVEDEEDEEEEEMPETTKIKESNTIPPYREGLYEVDPDDYSIENLTRIVSQRYILIENIDQINEYAEIYCKYPTQENKINVKRHIIAYARACAYYGRKNIIHEEIEKILVNITVKDEKDELKLSKLKGYLDDGQFRDEEDYFKLQRIANECVYLLNSLYYVEAQNNPPYPRAPPPLERFPLSPVEGYQTDLPSGEIVDMLLAFTMHALEPRTLFEMVLENRDEIMRSFETIRSRNLGNIFHFNVDPTILKKELNKTISNAEGVVMYIIHAFQMFIVYGNFIVDETDHLVKRINPEQLINKSELQSTAYLYLSMHGEIPVKEGTYRKKTPYTKKISKDVQKVTKLMPPGSGMRIFMQKQAEPLAVTKTSCCLETYQTGTISYESGICSLTCKEKDPSLCDCEDYLGDTFLFTTLSFEVTDELSNNKIPSVAYMQQTFNNCRQELMETSNIHPRWSRVHEPEMFIYKPGNIKVADQLKIKKNALPRKREFIGRIPLHTNKYINKIFETDVEKRFYGIYDLLTGNLISATDPFTTYIAQQDNSLISELHKIRKDITDNYEGIPNSPIYMLKCSLTDIINYFNSLGYKNIFLFDYSCESDDINLTDKRRIRMSDYIGTEGYGLTKKSRRLRRQAKKTRKNFRSKSKKYNHLKSK
jgi:hypothetical protein